MNPGKSDCFSKAAELILELSADAHIQRREVSKESAAFHNLTGAIAGYGRVLAGLTVLQESEGLFTFVGEHDAPEDAGMAERLSYVA
jgi:hypothetical protein